ncbi:hypothetical protein [Streptomyces ficellus]|uniref:hypothetical protein n=1 Tax=Streptomyces ficellus TaxID=1977088 RepID=UPI001FCC480E|nr:hypothetical protein [Streptomyces ficellus]
MSLLPSADVFRSIELKVPQLLRGQLVCPHASGERCSVGEHLTLSEAKQAAARDAADVVVRDALWRCVGRDARSDVPNLAQRGQLLALYFVIPYLRKSAARVSRRLCVDVAEVRSAVLVGALYGLALAGEADDVRDEVVRAANAAGWAVERADPAERTTDPQSLVDRAGLLDDGYSPIRKESDIQAVGEVGSLLGERISGERMGATLHRLGLLGAFLASGSGQVSEGESDERDVPQEEAE